MPAYSSADHPIVKSVQWDPARGAERINDFIWMSRGTSNGYLVTSDAGDVVINAGLPHQGARYRERYEQALGRKLDVKKIIFTQHHADNRGGWSHFADEGAETIVQRNFPVLIAEWDALSAYFMPRNRAVLHAILGMSAPLPRQPLPPAPPPAIPAPDNPTLFDRSYDFTVGGRRYELHSTPSGETLDSLMVWLPAEKVVFTGNWMGALYGALPHFYTVRGDRQRSVPQFMRDLERLIAWAPKLLITGHDEPIVGAERIHADMTKLLSAVQHIHDATIEGMNAGRPLSTLMAEVKLPDDLVMAPGRGPTSWYVRAVYEEYSGWFRQEATTELFAEPARSVWPELAAMAGGVEALAGRARERLAAGQPVQALHFLDIALAAEPGNRAVRETEIAALEQLIDLGQGRAFDEICWLETKIADARAAMAA